MTSTVLLLLPTREVPGAAFEGGVAQSKRPPPRRLHWKVLWIGRRQTCTSAYAVRACGALPPPVVRCAGWGGVCIDVAPLRLTCSLLRRIEEELMGYASLRAGRCHAAYPTCWKARNTVMG